MRLTLFSVGEIEEGFHGGGGVGGIDRAVAVGVGGILLGGAGGAALRVGLGEDDGEMCEICGGGDDAKAVGGAADLVRRAHADVAAAGAGGRGAGCPWDGRR